MASNLVRLRLRWPRTLLSGLFCERCVPRSSARCRFVSGEADEVLVTKSSSAVNKDRPLSTEQPIILKACGDPILLDEEEQEDMFVEPYDESFLGREWGGPRRGGRLPEPTRYKDWERKGRCTDF